MFWQDHTGNILTTAGSAEYSRVRFMLFHIIVVDTIQSFVQKTCGTEMDIVYLTAVFGVNLYNKIIFCMDVLLRSETFNFYGL